MTIQRYFWLPLSLACSYACAQQPNDPVRPRARDLGLEIGILQTGPLNSITDVVGVSVGHTTVIEGDNVRTGVTAVLPHAGNLFQDKVPGAVFVGNGFGKLAGSTQINELGEIETPIVLTSTLSVPRVSDAVIDYMIAMPGNEDVRSINPIVAETNDGRLNDGRGRHISRDHVLAAIRGAHTGAIEEGAVGAGTGTISFGFKGGIGTSSRRLPPTLGGYTVGVLVQANFGGVLSIAGAPVGRELGRYYLMDIVRSPLTSDHSTSPQRTPGDQQVADVMRTDLAGGSVIIIIATDAPVDHRNLMRMGARAMMGLARTGSSATGDSGDYAIAFSVAPDLRTHVNARARSPSDPALPPSLKNIRLLPNEAMSPLFLAVIEATEEAIYNSLLRATTTTANGQTVEALPIARTVEILRQYRVLKDAN